MIPSSQILVTPLTTHMRPRITILQFDMISADVLKTETNNECLIAGVVTIARIRISSA